MNILAHKAGIFLFFMDFLAKSFGSFKLFCNFVPNHTNTESMKRTGLILLLMCFALMGKADDVRYSSERPLIFGIDMNYPPMEYVDAVGIPHGLDVEFTKKLMNRLKLPFTYAPNTWENIADDIIKGRVDLGMMVYSTYRKDITNYSRPVFRLYYQIVHRDTDKAPYGLRDVSGKEIALMLSRPTKDTLEKVGAKPIVIKDLTKALTELSQGKYDGVICFRYQARYLIEKHGLDNLVATDLALIPREYCYVSHDRHLIDRINTELEKMDEEGVVEDVYGDIKTTFSGLYIPMWVWLLITSIIFLSLIGFIIQQRISRKHILFEIERAQQSEELKDVFLNNLSHALRTPLNAIIGFSDLMMTMPKDDMPEEEHQHLLGLINSNGLQLLHLINELLSLSDIEGNKQLFERKVVDVDAEMTAYVAETRMQLNKGVKLEVIEPIGGIRAIVDPKLLKIVTMHMLENARQHTTEGKITLSYYAKEGGFYVEVKDTGNGLPAKLKENIFALLSDKNTYVQEDTPGLGLSICKAIIEKGKGKIGARDNEEDGHGTIIWFWAPIEILN